MLLAVLLVANMHTCVCARAQQPHGMHLMSVASCHSFDLFCPCDWLLACVRDSMHYVHSQRGRALMKCFKALDVSMYQVNIPGRGCRTTKGCGMVWAQIASAHRW